MYYAIYAYKSELYNLLCYEIGYVDINTALGLPSASNNELPQNKETNTTESVSKDKKKEKKKLKPLTVEDLLNIPFPKEEEKLRGKNHLNLRFCIRQNICSINEISFFFYEKHKIG